VRPILLTGLPGTGKTTVMEKLVERLRDLEPAGFLTREIRQAGSRTNPEQCKDGGCFACVWNVGSQ